MPNHDIVDRLWAASEHDEGVPLSEAQALFIEAAEMIKMLRSLFEPGEENNLEEMEPQGRA